MFSERIKQLRKMNNLTQSELANKLNCSISKVGMWETDKREPTKDDLILLANIFEVSIDYMLGRNTEKEESDLPIEFEKPNEALEFILKQKTLMAFGGYDVSKLSDDELLDFANDLLQQLKLLGYKYNK
ncbi:helix-turn-helix domain-containing protein [Intestinibacter sp.]